MRLALDCRLRYGVGRILRNVVPLLAAELEHIVLLGDPAALSGWAEGLRNVSVQPFTERVYGLREQLRFPYWLRRRVDVLHVPHFNVPLGWRGPLVVTINDLLPLSDALPVNLAQRLYARVLIGLAVRRAQHVVTISKHARTVLQQAYSVPDWKLTTALCGVDRAIFNAEPADDDALLESLPGAAGPFILVVGSLRPHKNLNALLRAYEVLRRDYAVAQPLLVVGASTGFRVNVPVVEVTPDTRAHIHYCGVVNDRQLAALYRRCSVFAFPSLYEGFGLPPLEAMACGAAVVVSDRTSLPEVVGDAGLTVDADDVAALAAAVQRVLADASLRTSLREKAVNRAADFTWERAASAYLRAYRLACAR